MSNMKENNQLKVKSCQQVTFSEFVIEYFDWKFKLKVIPTKFSYLKRIIEKNILPFLGDKMISKITMKEIKELNIYLEGKGFSESTIRHILMLLSSVFVEALKNGAIRKNPMAHFRIPRIQHVPERIIRSNNELKRFLNTAEQENDDMIYQFGLLTGTRLNELLVLTWSDINLEKKTVTISKYLNGEGQPEKIRSGHHEVPLPPHLIGKLKLYKEQYETDKKELGDLYRHELELVFPNKKGGF